MEELSNKEQSGQLQNGEPLPDGGTLPEISELKTEQTEEMEVHHPHHLTHKKKWSEYFLEFLMLFLAVFLGFVAENIREGYIERHREHQYIEGLVQNLKTDTAAIEQAVAANLIKERAWDSLIRLSDKDLKEKQNVALFYKYFTQAATIPVFRTTDAAIVQLKSSGNLRLIGNKEIADSILGYDRANQVIANHNQMYFELHNNMWESAYPIFKADLLVDRSKVDYFARRLVSTDFPALGGSEQQQQVFFGFMGRCILFSNVNRNYMLQQKVRAVNLITMLQKQYHLGDE